MHVSMIHMILDHDAFVHDARMYDACIYDPRSLALIHVSMMRYFSVTNRRTDEPTDTAILGVGLINILQVGYSNSASRSSSFSTSNSSLRYDVTMAMFIFVSGYKPSYVLTF